MPLQPTWLQHIPTILQSLALLPAPVVDRFTIERLFSLSRRQAIRLMHQFGGYQIGRTFLIHRDELIHHLQAMHSAPPAIQVRNRKRRIWLDLNEHRRRVKATSVPIQPSPAASALSSLPPDVRLSHGHLEIHFQRPHQLLAHLYALSQALAEDYHLFASQYPPETQSPV